MIWLGLIYWVLASIGLFVCIYLQFLHFSNPNWPKIEIPVTPKECWDIAVCSILVGFVVALCGLGITALVVG